MKDSWNCTDRKWNPARRPKQNHINNLLKKNQEIHRKRTRDLGKQGKIHWKNCNPAAKSELPEKKPHQRIPSDQQAVRTSAPFPGPVRLSPCLPACFLPAAARIVGGAVGGQQQEMFCRVEPNIYLATYAMETSLLWKPVQTTIKKSSKFTKKITHADDMMTHDIVKYLVQTRLRLWDIKITNF